MFGDVAISLLKELKRTSGALTPYDEEGARQVLEEMSQLIERIHKTKELYPERYKFDSVVNCQSYLYLFSVEFNKRSLLAYWQHRLELIQSACWELGTLLPPTELKDKMARFEVDFYKSYHKLVLSYGNSYDDLEISSTLQPPKELFIEVRVLKECGEIQTEHGTLNLQKNSQHYVRRTDVEHLVRQGYLAHIV